MTAPVAPELRRLVAERAGRRCEFVGAEIKLLTPGGRVTVRLVRLNDPDRLIERPRLIEAGWF